MRRVNKHRAFLQLQLLLLLSDSRGFIAHHRNKIGGGGGGGKQVRGGRMGTGTGMGTRRNGAVGSRRCVVAVVPLCANLQGITRG